MSFPKSRSANFFIPSFVGASFKNVKQVHDSILAGAESVTVGTEVLKQMIYHPYTDWSIDKFESDWKKVYGANKTLLEIL